MEMTKVKITPQMASKWLETVNVKNRTISRAKVDLYADELTNGTWRETHQNAIAFYIDGVLADGQHRLGAIVKSGVSLEMFVANGLSYADGAAIDQGRGRSLADALTIGGMVESNKHISAQVSIVRMIRQAETGVIKTMSASCTAEKIRLMSEGIHFAASALSSAPRGISNATVKAAVAVAAYHMTTIKLQRICRVLVSGMPEGQEDAMIIRLRNLLIENKKYGATEKIEAYRFTLHALNADNDGRDLKIIRRVQENAFRIGIFDNG